MTKRLLCPERLRRVPPQFSWIDQRLLREGHLARCGAPQPLALYLLLVTAADTQGLSYYSDKTSARLLSLSQRDLQEARRALLQAGLIAYEAPLYQVLSLEAPRLPVAAPPLAHSPGAARSGEALPISEILRQMLQSHPPTQP